MALENPERDSPKSGPLLDISAASPLPGVVVVTAVGEIDMSSAPRLHGALLDAAAAGPDHILIDLQAVTFFCGAGVRPLVAARDAAASGAFGLHLTGVTGNRPVAIVLDAIHLTAQFTIHATVDDALAGITAVADH